MAEKKYDPADHSDDLAVLLRTNNKLLAEQIVQLASLNHQVHLIALSIVALASPLSEKQRDQLAMVTKLSDEFVDSEAQKLGKRLGSLAENA